MIDDKILHDLEILEQEKVKRQKKTFINPLVRTVLGRGYDRARST